MRYFHEQLQDVLKQITIMGSLTESMITLAMRMLVERDESLADEIYRKEDEVNALQVSIDDTAIGLIATQQPVGKDVRFLFMTSKIVTDLERIADQAKNICQNAQFVLAQLRHQGDWDPDPNSTVQLLRTVSSRPMRPASASTT